MCATLYSKITVVDLNGKLMHFYRLLSMYVHTRGHTMVHFCHCRSVVERLVELCMWPATPVTAKLALTM